MEAYEGVPGVPGSKTWLVCFDNDECSVVAAVGRPVDVHAYADRIVSARTAASLASTGAPSNAAARSATSGITCRYEIGRDPARFREMERKSRLLKSREISLAAFRAVTLKGPGD